MARIEGLDAVEAKLRALSNPKAAKRAATRAARKAMNIVRDAARQNAKAIDDPETREKIWKNIATQTGKTRNAGEIKMRVGVRGGASFSNPVSPNVSGGDTRHWRWVELGASHTPATPFMRPALQANTERVTNKFVEEFSAEIDKEIAKL